MTSISLENVTATYSSRTVGLDDLSLEIQSGQLVVVVGPSGCGKTTLLRVIAGLKRVDSGKVCFDGKEMNAIAPRSRNLAMVFQSDALYSHLSVSENLIFGERLRKNSGNADAGRKRGNLKSPLIQDAINRLGIDGLLDRKPFQLSGGERQRVALGRTLVRDPAAFLLDEPFSGIDVILKDDLIEFVKEQQRRRPTTMMLVTHHQADALALADSIVVMKAGRIHQVGSPEDIYDRPVDSFVASFFGRPAINLLEALATITPSDAKLALDGTTNCVQPALLAGVENERSTGNQTRLMLGIRPADIQINRIAEGVSDEQRSKARGDFDHGFDVVFFAKIIGKRRIGADWQVEFEVHDFDQRRSGKPRRLTAILDKATDIGIGDEVTASVDPEKIHFFDINSGRNIRTAED